MWITHDGPGQARVAARLPTLVVPRRDGFWRVGLTNVCETRLKQFEDDRIARWSVRLGVRPVIDAEPACGPVRPTPEGPLGQVIADGTVIRCSYVSQSIRFVSADYISVTTHSAKYGWCDDRGFQWDDEALVTRFDGGQQISYESIAGRAGMQSYTRAIAQGAQNIEADFNCPRDVNDIVDDSLGWLIRREQGHWMARAFMQPDAACQYEAPIDGTLPTQLTGHDTLAVPWAQIMRAVPEATDAFSSPQGDTLVVAINNEMQVFELAKGVIGRRLATFAAEGDVIMIQWALGANVARWTKTLRDAARGTLPAPTMRRSSRTP